MSGSHLQIPAKQLGFEKSHPWAGLGPGLARAWAWAGLTWVAWAGQKHRGPKRLDTSEGSGHFLNKSLAFSSAHPHMKEHLLTFSYSSNQFSNV